MLITGVPREPTGPSRSFFKTEGGVFRADPRPIGVAADAPSENVSRAANYRVHTQQFVANAPGLTARPQYSPNFPPRVMLSDGAG